MKRFGSLIAGLTGLAASAGAFWVAWRATQPFETTQGFHRMKPWVPWLCAAVGVFLALGGIAGVVLSLMKSGPVDDLAEDR